MKIEVTEMNASPYDLFVEHLAEQHDNGHVVDWVMGLVDKAMLAHPDYRDCDDDDCAECCHPIAEVRPVAHSIAGKQYRVATRPCEVCPACGGPVRPYRHIEMPDWQERDRAWANAGLEVVGKRAEV